jgi:D-cysteine desulfhydrase
MIPTDRHAPLLFEDLPGLARSIAWMPLAHAPTAVEPCDAVAPWLGRSGIFMKREDLISPLYGGNKVRRYEFVLADAKAKGAERIVTSGAIATTQAMATALFGRSLGFDVCVVLYEWSALTHFARDTILNLIGAGAEVIFHSFPLFAFARCYLEMRRPRSYFIMPGASYALANIGYVDAMLELGRQVERGEAPRPDVMVVPSGASGTLAALSLGAAHLGWDTEVIGVRIAAPYVCNRYTVNKIVQGTDRFLAERDPRWKPVADRVNFSIYTKALGRGYGYPTPEAIEGAGKVKALTGAMGEITYSGKGLVGLRAIAAMPQYKDKRILFWNTLSTPRPTAPPDARARVPRSLEWMFRKEPVCL